jgi:hypothetical protein
MKEYAQNCNTLTDGQANDFMKRLGCHRPVELETPDKVAPLSSSPEVAKAQPEQGPTRRWNAIAANL